MKVQSFQHKANNCKQKNRPNSNWPKNQVAGFPFRPVCVNSFTNTSNERVSVFARRFSGRKNGWEMFCLCCTFSACIENCASFHWQTDDELENWIYVSNDIHLFFNALLAPSSSNSYNLLSFGKLFTNTQITQNWVEMRKCCLFDWEEEIRSIFLYLATVAMFSFWSTDTPLGLLTTILFISLINWPQLREFVRGSSQNAARGFFCLVKR